MYNLKNINIYINIYKENLENIDTDIYIQKDVLENIYINIDKDNLDKQIKFSEDFGVFFMHF